MANYDKRGNPYLQTTWTRLTYIASGKRPVGKNWSGSDVIRIQSKKGKGNALQQGAEIPIKDKKELGQFIASIVEIFGEK